MRSLTAKNTSTEVSAASWVVRVTGALILLTVVLSVVGLLHDIGSESAARVSTVVLAITSPLVFLPALTTYLRHRTDPTTVSAWMTLSLTTVASLGLLLADTGSGWQSDAARLSLSSLLLELALTVVLLLAVAVAVGLIAVGAVGRHELCDHCARVGLAIGLTSIGVTRVASWRAPEDDASATIVVVGCLLGSAAFVGASARQALGLLRARAARLAELQERVDELEALESAQRVRRHEVANAVASIAMASGLLHNSQGLTAQDRSHLEEMLEHEAGRLSRLLTPVGAATSPTDRPRQEPLSPAEAEAEAAREVIDLDATLARIVDSEATVGHDISWSACGLRAVGAADDVAEVVRILLDNARAHEPTTRPRIVVRQADDRVEVVVADAHDTAVATGSHAARHGDGAHQVPIAGCLEEGAGLALARRLLEAQGGSLLLDCTSTGATFVLSLPAPTDRHASASGLAASSGSREPSSPR